MSKQQAPKGMYTSKQAREIMGVTPNVFYGMIRDGIIKKVVHPGRTEGFYPKLQVDNYTRQMKAINEPYSSEKLDFGLALIEDLPSIFELVASVSGGPKHAVPVEVLKAWIRRSPQSIHVLRQQNEVLGYVSGFILPMEMLMLRMDGRRLNAEIPIDDILPLDTPGPVPFYIAEMAVKFSQRSLDRGKPVPNALLGKILFEHTFKMITEELPSQGVEISELYAVGSSDFGINMCRKLGMHPIEGLTKGVRADRMPCKIAISELVELPLSNRLFNRSKAA